MVCRLSGVVTMLLLVLSMAGWAHADSTLLQQTQAADLMSGLLTYYGDLTTARRDAMRSYLEQIGKLQDYEAHKPAPAPRQDIAFADAFKGAVLFTQQHGVGLADGSLGKMPENQLRQEFGAIQHYNLEQFVDLNRKRDEIGSMKAYLDQIGQFDPYMRWAQERLGASAGPSTRPTTPTAQTAQGFADWIAEQAGSIKATAWQRAQAKGMSRQQFEAQWQDKLLELRRHVSSRVDAMRQLAGQLQPGDMTHAQPAAGRMAPANQTPQAFAAAPISPQDPRWTPYYYGPSRQFNSWADEYPDVYRRGADGGVFRSYDLRLNTDSDSRVNGELDRRQNTSGDRRLDFRVDPKVNY